jgi:transitional endoplasmic reticulum ATPase
MSETRSSGRTGTLKKKKNQWEMQQKERMSQMFLDPNISYADCIKASIDADKQNHRMSRINHHLRCFKNDGIYQLNKAITAVFGAVVSNEEKGPSVGDQTVNMVDIQLADGTRTKAPYGDISLETLGEGSMISINYDEAAHELCITGKCQQMYMSMMDDIIDHTKQLLATESIYKGQALEIVDINNPQILDLSSIDKQLMILSKDTKYALKPIEARLQNPEKCVQRGIPLKYGALLEGPYGTGKTLLAFKLAKEAVENNWIFIYLKDPSLLAEALRMSKIIDRSGHGALVFVEDIDQVTRGKRDASMQDILNTLDGGDTKDMNVISLFTTNHIELIEPTFLRGKRIGTIISMGFLDAETALDFIKESFAIGNYHIAEDMTEVCELIAKSDIAPAFMAEIVEAVKARLVFDERQDVTKQDIEYAVKSYLHQVELAKKKPSDETVEQKLGDAMREVITSATNKLVEQKAAEIMEKLDD